jgi:acylphosphatase
MQLCLFSGFFDTISFYDINGGGGRMKARAHLYISGRVQGVSYRWFASDVAHALKLTGWVRNLPDTRVEAVFEGGREAIEKAIIECRQGPPASRVSAVDVTWETNLEGFSDFNIRH